MIGKVIAVWLCNSIISCLAAFVICIFLYMSLPLNMMMGISNHTIRGILLLHENWSWIYELFCSYKLEVRFTDRFVFTNSMKNMTIQESVYCIISFKFVLFTTKYKILRKMSIVLWLIFSSTLDCINIRIDKGCQNIVFIIKCMV